MRVGFIGLGAMGQGMAHNLLVAGHDVQVWNRTPARAKPLVAEGARLAKTVADACKDAAVVFTMVADDSALVDLVTGSDEAPGIEESLGEGDVHVSLSTISASLSSRLAEAHEASGQRFVAAPVFGRPDMAAAGKLLVVAAGDDAAIARVQPLLEKLARKVFVVGDDPATANLVKLGGNFLLASMVETLGEVFALLRKSGVAPAQFLEIVNGNLMGSPIYDAYGKTIAEGRFDPPGFKLHLGLKDVRLVLAAADHVGTPMPIASLLRDQLLTAVSRGKADLDWSALAEVALENAGIAPAPRAAQEKKGKKEGGH
jgi:3-hydroxyisobutyrate dehydrogenase-like beta-hydroxyacid dehydrogenase